MPVTFYQNTNAACALGGAVPIVVVQLRLPNTGVYALFGKVIVSCGVPGPEGFIATMTTLDGTTILDTSLCTVSGAVITADTACLSLMATVDLAAATANEIIDIRCSAIAGQAINAVLCALPVDLISGSV